MKKLILLIGMQKTGTTSIQTACSKNSKVLGASGFIYPVMKNNNGDGTFFWDPNHSRTLTPIFKKESISADFRSLQQDEIRAHEALKTRRRETFKNFLESSQSNLLLIAEECSLLAPNELLDLRDFFNSLNFEIQVYCCIRSPSSWLTSMVAQIVMGKRAMRLTIADMIELCRTNNTIICGNIQKITKIIPDTKFYSFNAAISHKAGPAGYFLSLLGVDLGEGFSPIKENVMGSDHAVRINNEINKSLGNRYQVKGNNDFYTALPLKYPALFKIPGNKFVLREAEVATLLPCLIKENEWLKNSLGEGFYDENIEFSKNPVLLDEETRQFLINNFSAAEQPVKQIVQRYLAQY